MKTDLKKSVFTITAFAVATRALGFGLRVYLAARLGALLLGVYQVAFSFFAVLLGVVASGIPLAVSALTAKFDEKTGGGVATAGLIASLAVTAATIGLLLVCRVPLTALMSDATSYSVLLMLLPALACSGAGAAFRGSVWGRKRYVAVSAAELVEQIVRIAACVLLLEACPRLPFGRAHAAALAMSIGCAASALVLVALYFRDGYRLRRPVLLRALVSVSAPITVVRVASSAVNLIIAVLLPLRLIASGLTQDAAMALYGESVGMALGFLWIPLTLTGSLSMALVPELSNGMQGADCDRVRGLCSRGLCFAVLTTGFFVPVFAVHGENVGAVFFGSARAGLFLMRSAPVMIPLALEQIASSMMNSLGLEKRAFVNFLVGTAALLAILWFVTPLVGVDALGLGMFASYSVSMVLHTFALRERISMPLSYLGTLARTLGAIALACAVGYPLATLTDRLGPAASLVIGAVVQTACVLGGYLVFGCIRGGALVRAPKNAGRARVRRHPLGTSKHPQA